MGARAPSGPRVVRPPEVSFRAPVSPERRLRLLLAVAFALSAACLGVLSLPPSSVHAVTTGTTTTTAVAPPGTAIDRLAAAAAAAPAQSAPEVISVPASTTTAPTLALHVSVSPTAICANNGSGCAAGTGQARVSLTAQAINSPTPFWPDVQVAFIIETTAYDGVFDHYNSFYGQDPCAAATSGQGPVCEESNGVPFFIANAGTVASAIQAANPHSNVSFALVDFFGTDCGDWDDCGDGYKYHVDIPQFIAT